MCAMTTSNDEIRQRLGAWNEPAPQPPIAPDAKAHLEAIPTGNPDEPDLMAWRPPRHRRAMAGRAASVRDALVSAGGIATRAELAAMVSERALRTAVDKRIIVSLRPGVYGLPAAMDDPPKPEPVLAPSSVRNYAPSGWPAPAAPPRSRAARCRT